MTMAIAWAGGMLVASRPMTMVGNAMPITPLTNPASMKTKAMAKRIGSSMARTLTGTAAPHNLEVTEKAFG